MVTQTLLFCCMGFVETFELILGISFKLNFLLLHFDALGFQIFVFFLEHSNALVHVLLGLLSDKGLLQAVSN